MAQNGHKEHPKYMNIFWWLTGLTVLELLVVIPDFPTVVKAILLIGLACAKAILVANYFMHLKFERKTLAIYRNDPLPYLRSARFRVDARPHVRLTNRRRNGTNNRSCRYVRSLISNFAWAR